MWIMLKKLNYFFSHPQGSSFPYEASSFPYEASAFPHSPSFPYEASSFPHSPSFPQKRESTPHNQYSGASLDSRLHGNDKVHKTMTFPYEASAFPRKRESTSHFLHRWGFALLLGFFSLQGQAYYSQHYHSNPFCSPGMMMAMLQSQNQFDPNAERKALRKQIRKLNEEVSALKSKVEPRLDTDYGSEVLQQIIDFHLGDLSKNQFAKEEGICGAAADHLQCFSKGSDNFKACSHTDASGKCTLAAGSTSLRNDIISQVNKECEVFKMWKGCIGSGKNIKPWICKKNEMYKCSMELNTAATCPPAQEHIKTRKYGIRNSLIPDDDAFGSSSTRRRGQRRDSSENSDSPSSTGCTDLDDLLDKQEELDKLKKQQEDFDKLFEEEEDYSWKEYIDDHDPAAKVNCMECNGKHAMIDRMERWYKPDKWQRIGQAVSSIGGMALGWYGIREANKARARQGFPAQAGHAVQLAYPFIEQGIYGAGMFGSSLACSPTAGRGFRGGLLGGLFGGRGRWGGWHGGGPWGGQGGWGGGPGVWGGGPGVWAGGPGVWGGGGPWGGGPGRGVWGGGPGTWSGGPGTWGGGPGSFGIDFGLGGGPGGGVWGGGGPWGGGPGGVWGGGPGVWGGGGPWGGGPGGPGGGYAQMQAQMEYQKAMMAYRQNQMNNWMQKQQSTQALRMEINRLHTQMYEIWYGGGTGGHFTTAGNVGFHASIGGGGSTTRQPGGSTVSLGR